MVNVSRGQTEQPRDRPTRDVSRNVTQQHQPQQHSSAESQATQEIHLDASHKQFLQQLQARGARFVMSCHSCTWTNIMLLLLMMMMMRMMMLIVIIITNIALTVCRVSTEFTSRLPAVMAKTRKNCRSKSVTLLRYFLDKNSVF